MKVSHQGLQKFFAKSIAAQDIPGILNSLGLEVEGEHSIANLFSGVIVAEVVAVERHPDADKLSVCSVKTTANAEHCLTIVCGAKNVRPTLKVALATVGAVLPGNFRIKKSKLRGVVSEGMLCAAEELSLSDQRGDGIIELPKDAPLGKDFAQYLNMDDTIWDLSITPNRADCLSMHGVARELALKINQPCIDPVPSDLGLTPGDVHEPPVVSVESDSECLRFASIRLKLHSTESTTPIDIQETLRRCGIRAVHPVVDILNYVMLMHGQPMHAYDAEKIDGKMFVRRAQKGEQLLLLTGQQISLSETDLVIADQQNVLALAGVMGGQVAEVTQSTKEIIIESAFFSPDVIRSAVQSHMIHTDASHRFERGVDPNLQEPMLAHAVRLIGQLCGADFSRPVQVEEDSYLGGAQSRPSITLRYDRVRRVLGVELPVINIVQIMEQLGMQISNCDGGVNVQVPSYRYDLSEEIDLIEEVARIHGYDALPDQALCFSDLKISAQSPYLRQERLANMLSYLGYQEAINYAFISRSSYQQIEGKAPPHELTLKNPLSEDMVVMRSSLLPGLIKSLVYNVNRQKARVRLFEQGVCFSAQRHEKQCVAGVLYGSSLPIQWADKPREIDFYDCKHDVMSILAEFGWTVPDMQISASTHHAFHPHQSAQIECGGSTLGHFGVLHPKISSMYKISNKIIAFEFEIKYNDDYEVNSLLISDAPTVGRDIALLVPNEVKFSVVQSFIEDFDEKILKKCILFDIYRGSGVAHGYRSMAFKLVFQDQQRTLTDTEVDAVLGRLVAEMNKQFKISLRET